MKLNTLVFALTLASAGAASAATLDMVTVSTAPATTGQASFNWDAGGLTSLTGTVPAAHQASAGGEVVMSLLNSTVAETGGSFTVDGVVLASLPPGPVPLLAGSVVETRVNVGGNIELLLDQVAGSSSAGYGDYLVLTLLTGLAFDAGVTGAYTTDFTLYGAEEIVAAPVPLPASMLLLLGGVAGLAGMRRRS